MTAYVDNMRRRHHVTGSRPANWSHLFADTPAELREFGALIGMRPEWLQHDGTHREHYDLTDTRRDAALEWGAVAITYPDGTGKLLEARRKVCRCPALPLCRWGDIATEAAAATSTEGTP